MSFKEEIDRIFSKHQLDTYNQFNIFKVMFKPHDEKYLHSRFISFLLDPNGSHKQGTKFLELFFEVINLSHFSFEGIEVNPNERERSEIHNIDILIRNRYNEAIIIENKVFAKDQTILDGQTLAENPLLKYQLTRYYYKVAELDKYKVVKMIYLTIDGKYPEDFEKFPDVVKSLIDIKDHLSDIAKWLNLCLEKLSTDSDLKIIVEQYKQARFQFLNNVQLAIELKSFTAIHFEEAKKFWLNTNADEDVKYHIIKNQFKHVKWHTVHEFYRMLEKAIFNTFGNEVDEVNNEHITSVTHKNSIIRKTKSKDNTILNFTYRNTYYYVCNDKNGFSIGGLKHPQNEKQFEFLFKDRHYGWFDFTNDEVFELIKPEKRDELVEQILNHLKDFVNK